MILQMKQKTKFLKNKTTPLIKGTSYDFIFQMSLFSTLAHIFAYLKTPPIH